MTPRLRRDGLCLVCQKPRKIARPPARTIPVKWYTREPFCCSTVRAALARRHSYPCRHPHTKGGSVTPIDDDCANAASFLTFAPYEADVAFAKVIIKRGWDNHMANFELMDERDENWLLRWAGLDEAVNEHWGFPDDAPSRP